MNRNLPRQATEFYLNLPASHNLKVSFLMQLSYGGSLLSPTPVDLKAQSAIVVGIAVSLHSSGHLTT